MNTDQHSVLLSTILGLIMLGQSLAQDTDPLATFAAAQELPLYSGVAPGSEQWDYAEVAIQGKSGPQIKNVVRPTLLHFPAPQPVGTAMIVAPGGGDRTLMMSYEGVDIAKQLNAVGVDVFCTEVSL